MRTPLLTLLLLSLAWPSGAALLPVGSELPLYGFVEGPDFDESAPALAVNPLDDQALYMWSSSITVDAEAILGAASTLDATFQLVFGLFVIAPESVNPRDVAGAFDPVSRTYLVVWSQEDAPGAFEIWGRTIAADFLTLSDPFRISTMGQTDTDARFDGVRPDVVARNDDGGFLVVWCGDDDGSGLNDGETEIFARLVSTAGVPQGNGRQRVSDRAAAGGSALAPAVAYDDFRREFLVVYEGTSTGALPSILAARLGFDASPLAIDTVVNASSPATLSRDPDVAYDSRQNRHLVVWDERAPVGGDASIRARLVEPGGPTHPVVLVSTPGSGGGPMRVARDARVAYSLFSDGFVVAWSGAPAASTVAFEILAREVDRDGVAQGSGPVQLTETAAPGAPGVEAVSPAIVASTRQNTVLTVWSDSESTPYRFDFIRRMSTLDVASSVPEVPVPVALALKAAPNPFNPSTTLTFALPRAGKARVTIHDARGQLVRTLVDETMTAGVHVRTWDGRDDRGVGVGSGVYHARFAHPAGERTEKLVLVK